MRRYRVVGRHAVAVQGTMTTKWLQQVMPKSVYSKLKGMIVFRPEDPINLWQATPQMQTGSKVERIKGYRYPAPRSVRGGESIQIEALFSFFIKTNVEKPVHGSGLG